VGSSSRTLRRHSSSLRKVPEQVGTALLHLTTFALSHNFVHAVLNVVTGRVTFSTSCLMNKQNLHPATCGSPGFLPCFHIHSALAPNLQSTGPGRGVT